MDKLYIVGYGVGGSSFLTGEAKDIIDKADRILSTGRISKGLLMEKSVKSCTLSQLLLELKEKASGPTAVLVSGDCGFFSVSKNIVKDFKGLYDIEIINGISSIQYFSAKLAINYDDAVICSMHGRDERIIPKVAYNKKVFALTGGENKAHDICKALYESGLDGVNIYIGENLSYTDEKIVNGTAKGLKDECFGDLSVMYIENNRFANRNTPLCDDDFIRGNAPMTKEEVRWISVQKLGIMPSDIVYDIGAGTGSVSIELARKAYDGFVYAVEMKDDACALIRENIKKHGAFNIRVVPHTAPSGILPLPAPDKVFIGGTTGQIKDILDCIITKNPNVKVVSNAITLQSISQILSAYAESGLTETEVICVNVAKSKKIGGYDMMLAQNPIYIITGFKGNSRQENTNE